MALPDELRALAAEVSNWGRWGDDDELGTLNLIDDAAVARGVAAARTGQRFPLAIRLDANGPQMGNVPGRTNPLHTMVAINQTYTGDPTDACFNDDTVSLGLQAGTHWDALAHVSYDGPLYNGFPAASVTADRRVGPLRDPPGHQRGQPGDPARRGPGQGRRPARPAATRSPRPTSRRPWSWPACARSRATSCSCAPGRWPASRPATAQGYTLEPTPGLTVGTIRWMRRHDVAAVATDTFTLEVVPGEDPAVLFPVHMIQLRDMGLLQGQNFDLEALSAHCAADGVYEMLLVANPEPFTGGAGAPTAPVAIK